MADLLQRTVSVDQLGTAQSHLHDQHHKAVQRIHWCFHVWRWLDRFWPVCACGELGEPCLSENEAMAQVCARETTTV